MTINVQSYGTGQRKSVVLFHGWGFDSRVWEPILPMLAPYVDVYCIDLPGFGFTSYMPWDAFIQALMVRLPQRFAIMGWSMGGLLATQLALTYPDRVTHVINVASSPRFVEDEHWPGLSESVLLSYQQRLSDHPDDVLSAFIAKQLPGQNQETYPLATIEGLRAGLDCLLTWDLRSRLRLLQCPVLYLFGSRDDIVPIHTMKVMTHEYPQYQYRMIRKAAHALFLSHPQVTTTTMIDFLN